MTPARFLGLIFAAALLAYWLFMMVAMFGLIGTIDFDGKPEGGEVSYDYLANLYLPPLLAGLLLYFSLRRLRDTNDA